MSYKMSSFKVVMDTTVLSTVLKIRDKTVLSAVYADCRHDHRVHTASVLET